MEQDNHQIATQDEIERILNLPENELPVEQAIPPQHSPLNQPVAEKNFQQQTPPQQATPNNESVPFEMLKLAANSIFATANNIIGLGAGYFVKIKKHKEFFELDEVIHLIDAQNEKNVNALKLTQDDKDMLMPLVVQVLRNRAKLPTPEQQLLMITLTILMQKARVFMQIRQENQEMTEQILVAIRASREPAPTPTQTTREYAPTPEAPAPEYFAPQEQLTELDAETPEHFSAQPQDASAPAFAQSTLAPETQKPPFTVEKGIEAAPNQLVNTQNEEKSAPNPAKHLKKRKQSVTEKARPEAENPAQDSPDSKPEIHSTEEPEKSPGQKPGSKHLIGLDNPTDQKETSLGDQEDAADPGPS